MLEYRPDQDEVLFIFFTLYFEDPDLIAFILIDINLTLDPILFIVDKPFYLAISQSTLTNQSKTLIHSSMDDFFLEMASNPTLKPTASKLLAKIPSSNQDVAENISVPRGFNNSNEDGLSDAFSSILPNLPFSTKCHLVSI